MRFEPKHLYFKHILQSAQNFKNRCKTLAYKHEYRKAFLSSNPTKMETEITHKGRKNYSFHTECNRRAGITSDCVYSCNLASVKGTKYETGMYVVTGFDNDEPKFGLIWKIICHQSQVLFLTYVQKTSLNHHLSAYIVNQSSKAEAVFQKNIVAYYG